MWSGKGRERELEVRLGAAATGGYQRLVWSCGNELGADLGDTGWAAPGVGAPRSEATTPFAKHSGTAVRIIMPIGTARRRVC